MIWRKNKEDGC